MSILQSLQIRNFRNLIETQADFNHRFNVFYGDNGSGKTSLLEAIYYLGLARSFRTRLHPRLINHQANAFSIFGQVIYRDTHFPIGIQRQQDSACQIHIAGEPTTTAVELIKLLPLQLLDANSHELLGGETKTRRQFLDWGVFHVEPIFWPTWQRAERALKQRNAALKLQADKAQVQAWDVEFVQASQELHRLRGDYVKLFVPIAAKILEDLLADCQVTLHYHPGWSEDEDLALLLQRSLNHDYYLGYTRFGAHRADLQPRIGNIPAKDILSQGQQKLMAYAMRIAQGVLLQQMNKPCVYLIDDLPSELDAKKRQKVVQLLVLLEAQIFVTGVVRHDFADLLPPKATDWFHVEHGQLAKVGRAYA
ncbi:MAG: DNA replication/repair protein RecF [Gammaproteobacteria bacterium]